MPKRKPKTLGNKTRYKITKPVPKDTGRKKQTTKCSSDYGCYETTGDIYGKYQVGKPSLLTRIWSFIQRLFN